MILYISRLLACLQHPGVCVAAARPFALQREARDVLIAARVRSLSDCTQVVPGVNAGNRPVCPEAQGACASYKEPCAGGRLNASLPLTHNRLATPALLLGNLLLAPLVRQAADIPPMHAVTLRPDVLVAPDAVMPHEGPVVRTSHVRGEVELVHSAPQLLRGLGIQALHEFPMLGGAWGRIWPCRICAS